MGKGHSGKLDACLLAETNSVSDVELEAGITHAESPDTMEAWGLDSRQQVRDEITGKYVQFISSNSCDPIKIYRSYDVKKADTALISSQTEDQEMVYVNEGRNHDGRLLWVGIISALLTLTFCVIVLMLVLSH